jgi:uncharacterized protein (TIGR03435 family)
MTGHRALLAAVLSAAPLAAQASAPEPALAFEVASIKPHELPGNGFARRPWSAKIECPPFQCGISGTRFTEAIASLADLIMDAYRLRRFQIVGLPDWGDSGHDVYDVAAKTPGDQPATLDQVRRMLQMLLAERFQLKFHRETRALPAYALVVAKNGSKLKPGPDGPCDKLPGRAADDPNLPFLTSWERIPEMIGMFADRPVFDKTGYEGHYCTLDGQEPWFALDMRGLAGGRGRGVAAGPPPAGEPDGTVTIFSEVQQKWGLKLEAQKGPVDVLVIDHVSRPSVN